MQRPLLMPKLGLTMTEGVLVEWLVAPGARFKAGDGLYVVETDKVANEIPAQGDGVFVDALVPVGETVPCGAVIGYWDDTASAADATVQDAAEDNADDADDAASGVGRVVTSLIGQRVLASPLARRTARQHGIDLARLLGTGSGGRIVARDVQGPVGVTTGVPAATAATASESVPAAAPRGPSPSRLVQPTNMQATMARRLTAGKQETPHFYLALEAQVARLMALRAEFNESADAGIRLTVNHFIIAAVARALREMPAANRAWTAEGILEYAAADVGIAVDTPRGLVAPLLRDAASRRIADLAHRSNELVERARKGSLVAEDFEGGSITVSNAGMHNVTYMTPIINPGQSMILGVGSIRDVFRPDDAGRPQAMRELGLVLSVDHRVSDGVSALRFLNLVVDLLQRPARLLLD